MATSIKCESTLCRHNQEEECTKDAITIDDCSICDDFEEIEEEDEQENCCANGTCECPDEEP